MVTGIVGQGRGGARAEAPSAGDEVVTGLRVLRLVDTGHLVVVSEAPRESSVTSEVAARVSAEAFYSLQAPVVRVAGFDTPYPPSRLEEEYLPSLDRILDAVDRCLAFE